MNRLFLISLDGRIESDRVVATYLTPTIGSWLNRIESQFQKLKKLAMKPSDYRSHDEQQEANETFLTWCNRAYFNYTAWKQYQHEQAQVA